jgi:CheY-like chemotaxis protein
MLLMKKAEAKTAGSAEEAIAEIVTQHYDLCFLHYMLPGMTGSHENLIVR